MGHNSGITTTFFPRGLRSTMASYFVIYGEDALKPEIALTVEEVLRTALENLNNSMEHITQALQNLMLAKRERENRSSEEYNWIRPRNQKSKARHYNHEESPFVGNHNRRRDNQGNRENQENQGNRVNQGGDHINHRLMENVQLLS